MTRMSIITKSFSSDFDLCANLHQSLLDYAPRSINYDIIVPRRDLWQFNQLACPRTNIRCMADLLPRSFLPVRYSDFTINLRQPIPPVRGWILQQVVKLAAIAASTDDIVLVVDSDVEFVRPFGAGTFVRDGAVRFYRKPDEIGDGHPRHVIWHRVARELLGLPPAKPPYPDYISAMVACDPAIVRKMLARVAATTGLPWATAIARQLHFSEWTLYGVFVDHFMGARATAFASEQPLCLAYYDRTPLDRDGIARFLGRLRPTDVAAMISSKSGTPLEARRAAFAHHRTARSNGERRLAGLGGWFPPICGAVASWTDLAERLLPVV
jgi:hypothetical protein